MYLTAHGTTGSLHPRRTLASLAIHPSAMYSAFTRGFSDVQQKLFGDSHSTPAKVQQPTEAESPSISPRNVNRTPPRKKLPHSKRDTNSGRKHRAAKRQELRKRKREEMLEQQEEIHRLRLALKMALAGRDKTVAELRTEIAKQRMQSKNCADDQEIDIEAPSTCLIGACPEDEDPVCHVTAACVQCGAMMCRACAHGYSKVQGQQSLNLRRALVLQCPQCRDPRGFEFTGLAGSG